MLRARMGGNEINMTVGDEFITRRTYCVQQWVETRSIWPLVLNLQDDARAVGGNG